MERMGSREERACERARVNPEREVMASDFVREVRYADATEERRRLAEISQGKASPSVRVAPILRGRYSSGREYLLSILADPGLGSERDEFSDSDPGEDASDASFPGLDA